MTERLVLQEGFRTEGGAALQPVEVAYRTWGRLDGRGGNAVLVCHALTGSADADGWWAGLVGGGRIADPTRHFVICANALGSCYGTTGPGTPDPATGRRRGSSFPVVTIRDMARLHLQLLERLGVRRVELALGASMGGMQALEVALERPGLVRRLLLIGMGKAHTAWQVGISEAQRMAIRADARWRGGDFPTDDPPMGGLAAARAMAMMTYRSAALLEARFGRRLQPGGPGLFEVESYLQYQGKKLVERFDAGSYVRLTEAMDRHDVARGRGGDAAAVLGALQADALCVGITSDVLYPPAESRELAALLPRGEYAEVESPYGHDAFLVEFDRLERLVHPFLDRTGYFKPAALPA